ncbi:MAG: bifunctional glutamate N-acetyltransferase/amino-acid acetyltransferase ArgJ [Candidatus Omnitrophota bacterium]
MNKYILPEGFLASGIYCGVKKKRKDLSLLYSRKPCKAAALFTRNVVKAAPVIVAQDMLKKTRDIRGVVINSGNANCMTGREGIKDAREIIAYTAKLLKVPKDSILGSSTGIIGERMPVRAILGGLPQLVAGLSGDGLLDAVDGIMTTDGFRKISSRSFTVGEKTVRITGIAKGAGMVDPSMATMLCYILTDADITGRALKKALCSSTDRSFNSITVDGDMSTNDTVMLLANGEAGNETINEKSKNFRVFQEQLDAVTVELAKMVVRDGEGASKFIEVNVIGAKTAKDAKKVADAVAGSLLVKCAVLGGDPNWGRMASSAGSSGVNFDPDKLEIILDGVTFFREGKAVKHIDRRSTPVFKDPDVNITINLNMGTSEAKVYSCDISKKYITLNSYYTT